LKSEQIEFEQNDLLAKYDGKYAILWMIQNTHIYFRYILDLGGLCGKWRRDFPCRSILVGISDEGLQNIAKHAIEKNKPEYRIIIFLFAEYKIRNDRPSSM